MAYKEYEYDRQNRLKKTTFHMGEETQTYRPIYDTRASDGAVYADNAVVGVMLDGVFTSKAEQDDWGRVIKKDLTTAGSTTPLLSEEYGYLDVAVGFETRLTAMVQLLTRKVKGVTKDTLRYTYDNNGNITAIRDGTGTEYYAKYTYDGLNQLIREDNAVLGKSWVFTYDTAGNILSKKEYAYTTGTLGEVLDTKTYTYAATGWKDRLTSFNGEAIAYDALGNPTTYRGHALTWGRIRQLESYRIDSNTLLTFAYDASGLRTRKNSVVYQYDGEKIFVENRNSTILSYFYDMGGICGFKYDNVRYYYEKNLQGDITAVYDENGTLKAQYVYDAWGNHTITENVDGIATLNPFRYRGYYFDTETGLYYLNSRYYDPQTGRFINADVQMNRSILGNNLYTYCYNNPVIMRDSHGNSGVLLVAGIAGLLLLLGGTTSLILIGGATQASQDLSSQTIEINNPFDDIVDWWERQKLQREIRKALISSTIIAKGLTDIAGKYGNLECDKAAEEMKKYLKKKKEHGAIIILNFLNQGYVLSEKSTSTAISETGMHMGVLYKGMVYCNVYPTGLPEEIWVNSFYDASGLPPIVTKIPF